MLPLRIPKCMTEQNNNCVLLIIDLDLTFFVFVFSLMVRMYWFFIFYSKRPLQNSHIF